MPFYGTVLGKQKITLCFASYPSRVGNWGVPQFALPIARRSWQTVCQNIPWPRNDSFFSSLIKDSFKINELFKTDPSLATSARAAKESGSYLCASNVTPTAVRFIVSVFLCLLCSCRMPSTQMTCSHFRKNRPKKRQKPAGCRSRIISKNRPVPIFGRSTGASLHIFTKNKWDLMSRSLKLDIPHSNLNRINW